MKKLETKKLISTPDWSVHPPYLHADYKSTVKRAPQHDLALLPQRLSDLTGPAFGEGYVNSDDADLTMNARVNGEPIGERIMVMGKLSDDAGKPIANTLIEVWQANACGRYIHKLDHHDAPIDPNFKGAGRTLTNEKGEYCFTTIRPGAYPWRNHENAWRPAHIHFSVFGRSFNSRLITQMYFPGDPLLKYDPIFNGIPDEKGRERLISEYAHDQSKPEWALGYRFNIVVCGGQQTPFEEEH